MKTAHMMLALGMLITGSLNTIFTTWCDQQESLGTTPYNMWTKLDMEPGKSIQPVHLFNHPFFQALGMFVGEFLCMIAYGMTRKRRVQLEGEWWVAPPGGRTKGALWFAKPAMLDITGTGTMYAGLCLSYASVFQMLRGSSVVFTCALSCAFLGRKIHAFQWFSVLLIVIGITIVGYVSIANTKPGATKDQTSVMIGDILIVLAQVATAVQMVVEEKLMKKFPSAPLKVVGLEGMFGFVILSMALVPMYFIKPIPGYPIESIPDALAQAQNNLIIPLAMLGNSFSIAFFNFFGISVTQQLSASHRMVLDSVRTLVVWSASLALGWEVFHPLQLVGFVFLTLGTCIYNEVIRLPIFAYPEVLADTTTLGTLPESQRSLNTIVADFAEDNVVHRKDSLVDEDTENSPNNSLVIDPAKAVTPWVPRAVPERTRSQTDPIDGRTVSSVDDHEEDNTNGNY